MKINVEVDCTPEEARRFMGLPDLTPVHDAYLAKMLDVVNSGGMSGDAVEAMIKGWMPMGEAGVNLWQQLIGNMAGATKR